MLSPRETPRARRAWWLAAVLLSTAFLLAHALLVKTYLDRATDSRLRDEATLTPLRQISPSFALDGETWIRHALALTEGTSLRLRHTAIDNAPFGREVHWDSAWAWWLAGLGHLRAALTGDPLPAAIERAAFWANLPILLLVLAGFSAWAGRRLGALGAVVTALALAGHRGFYEGFFPSYPDHHGIINAALLGLVLGAVFMGAGWWLPVADRSAPALLPRSRALALRAATVSALAGAAGLWISAASVVIPIALTGAAGALAALFFSRDLRSAGAVAEPAVWRRWGRVGAAASLVFYLFEYAPSGFAPRLEVNNPLYALAWLGGGELLALFLTLRAAPPAAPGVSAARPPLSRWLPACLAVAAAPAALLIGGRRWFIPVDPFIARVHSNISEFQPLLSQIHRLGWWPYRDHAGVLLLPLLAAVATLLFARRLSAPARALLVFTLAIALPATALGWWQNRWLLTASSPQIALTLVLLFAWLASWRADRPAWLRAAAVLGACALLYGTAPWMLIRERLLVESKHDIQGGEAMQLLYRDLAQRLRADQPSGDLILLANPDASTGIGYYGRFRTLGTFYWENHDGLLAAAEIFSARTDDEAARLLRQRGVTHIALVSTFNFLVEYYLALHPGAPIDDVRSTFGWRLLFGHHTPLWLRPIDYDIPPQFSRLQLQVRLLAVDLPVMDPEPRTPQAAARRAWRLATTLENSLRDGPESLRLAQQVVKALPASAAARQVLAAAFAENARWAEANGAALYAIELAEDAGNYALSDRIKAQAAAYQKHLPWRE